MPSIVFSSSSYRYPTTLNHFSTVLQPENVSEPTTARPFSEIPKTKTVLGLNIEAMRDPLGMPLYVEKQFRTLGPIFHLVGLPSLPKMVFVVDPDDTERVFRTGDLGYPKRIGVEEWIQARKELNLPFGMFLE